jgi:hypothetical protein
MLVMALFCRSRKVKYLLDGELYGTLPLDLSTFQQLKSELYRQDARVGAPATVIAYVRSECADMHAQSGESDVLIAEGFFAGGLLPDGDLYVKLVPVRTKKTVRGWNGLVELT